MKIPTLCFLYFFCCSNAFACRPFINRAVSFPENDYLLSESESAKLADGLNLYQPLENAKIEVILIIGYASSDEHEHEEGRRMLSLKRAMSVQSWFVENGIPFSKTYIEGKGSGWERNVKAEQARRVDVDYMIMPNPDPCDRSRWYLPQKQK